MKKIIIFFLFLISFFSYSQNIEIEKINDIKYRLNHGIEYDLKIYESRILDEIKEIETIEIEKNGIVTFSFYKEISEKAILESLSKMVVFFNYKTFIIKD